MSFVALLMKEMKRKTFIITYDDGYGNWEKFEGNQHELKTHCEPLEAFDRMLEVLDGEAVNEAFIAHLKETNTHYELNSAGYVSYEGVSILVFQMKVLEAMCFNDRDHTIILKEIINRNQLEVAA